ncbi:MAG TPA: glycosyl hydrolase family 65 protein [Planctomycetota bacterium]|nr:glycosyl hydrolase family 65 protein [Planctomycetota bacterium]
MRPFQFACLVFSIGASAAQCVQFDSAGGWTKYEHNPVLGGQYGTCFDISVLREDGAYRMWVSWRPKKSTALVESKDGLSWSAPEVVLPPAKTGWEDDINRPVVLKRTDGYHMWYTGQAKGHSSIGYATSADGKNWKRMSEKPVLSAEKPWEKVAVMCPHVLWDEGAKQFRMWYSAGDQYEPNAIGYATSPDGLTWTKHEANPVFISDPNSAWEKHKVTACQVVQQNGWHVMFYIGFRDENHAQIGLARSKDGITNWERHPSNPIVRSGTNQWDHDACYKPYAIFDGEKWLLWYNGRRQSLEQIGVVIHPGEDLGFPMVLKPASLKHYVDEFNKTDNELYKQYIPNAAAWEFLADHIPLFDCPDKELEEIYYFRWWTYRKAINRTPDGFVITEFLPKVSWAGKYNTIDCAAGHHFREGRWLHDPKYLDDYATFWLRKGGAVRSYSFWIADSLLQRAAVTGDTKLALDLLPELIANYQGWEKERLDPSGLFWQVDDRDGMEASIGGSGFRATINSYMYGDALAIAQLAGMAGKADVANEYRDKAAQLKRFVQEKLWDKDAQFFKVLPRGKDTLADVREEHGFTPWYFNLPDADKSVAWKQLMDAQGFYAPYGPTTAEQRHLKFALSYQGHECQWNGPSWPFATSVTLTAMANLLNNYEQDFVTRKDYLEVLKIYAKSQHLKLDDGRVVPWIDENLNPQTGDWISRTRLKTWKNGTWDTGKGGEERGKDYNHSTYCDLVISGLIGLRARLDKMVEVNPLIPDGAWDYFCLDNVRYHGHTLTILYDKSGERYQKGKGLRIFADGKEIGAAEKLTRMTAPLTENARQP